MSYNFSNMKAGGYLPASFLDWDGHISSVIFFAGCNFRCPWCHNAPLVTGDCRSIALDSIIDEIARERDFLDGVVITGGEATLNAGLVPLLRYFRDELKIPVKLDTNGSNPNVIEEILKDGLVSHIAMDAKAPFNDSAYLRLTGRPIEAVKIKRTAEIIKRYAKSYEFRTTYIPQLLSIDDLRDIRATLNDDSHWILQLFKPNNCLDEQCREFAPATDKELKKIFPNIKIRG